MSKGNLKTQGAKGNNFDWQFAVVQLLGQIAAGSGSACPCPSNAQEATLLQVLGALQNGQEFEQALVMDLGGPGCPGNCPTYIQIRIWDTVNHVFLPPVYYNAAGAVVVPVGPLQFLNPQFVLENILTQVTAINGKLPTPGTKTPSLIRATGVGTVAAGAQAVSVYNAGGGSGIWLGQAIKPGEQLDYGVSGGDTLAAFAYDGTGTELVITTVV